MGIFPENAGGGQFLFPPKQGASLTVTIAGPIERVQNENGNAKSNYKGANDKNYGYYDVLPVVDAEGNETKMKINAWKLYFALKDVADSLDVGDEIMIDHPGRGEYKVTKV